MSKKESKVVHHHLIYQARVGNDELGKNSRNELENFLYDLLDVMELTCLIPAQVKLSDQQEWTGTVGLLTSHIAFHFWPVERHVQLDIYSFKEFDQNKTINFLNDFWQSSEVKKLLIERKPGKNFRIDKMEGLSDLEPVIYRQRCVIEGKQNIEITPKVIREYLRKLTLDILGMRIQLEPIIFSPDKMGNPLHHGLNGFIGWVESGGQFYSWDERKFFTMDIYTCKKFNPEKAIKFTKKFFKVKDGEIICRSMD